MNRILGIDYGGARIGIAVSEPLGIIASEVCVLQNINNDEVLANLKEIIDYYKISKIVLGLPLNMNDTEGFQAEIVREFGNLLTTTFNLEVIYVDERKSSVKAETILKELKVDVKTIRKQSDKKAASIILQDYLDYHQ